MFKAWDGRLIIDGPCQAHLHGNGGPLSARLLSRMWRCSKQPDIWNIRLFEECGGCGSVLSVPKVYKHRGDVRFGLMGVVPCCRWSLPALVFLDRLL